MFVAKESSGLRTNDEAFKMALTDAVSVACKALGIGANVYWEKDRTKYGVVTQDSETKDPADTAIPSVADKRINKGHWDALVAEAQGKKEVLAMALESLGYRSNKDLPVSKINDVRKAIQKYLTKESA